MHCDVECYAGYRGEETPRRVVLGKRRVDLVGVLDRWLEPDYRFFKVEGADGATYILRHHVRSARWSLTFEGLTAGRRGR